MQRGRGCWRRQCVGEVDRGGSGRVEGAPVSRDAQRASDGAAGRIRQPYMLVQHLQVYINIPSQAIKQPSEHHTSQHTPFNRV